MNISENIRIEEEKVIRNEIVSIKMNLVFKIGEQPGASAAISVTNDELKQESMVKLAIQLTKGGQNITFRQGELFRQFVDAVIEKAQATAKFKIVE